MPRINEELLTAYALDELPLSTRMEVKAYLAHHPEAELAVQAIQAAADQLRDELMTEIEQTPRPTVAPMRLRHPVRRPAAQWRVPIAVAASVAAVLGTFGALMYQARVGPVSDVAIRAEGERVARGTGPAQKLEEGPSVTGDVTRRSYADVLAQQMESPLPPPNLDFEAATPNTGWKQPGGAFGVATPAPAEPMVGMGAGTYGGKGKSYGVGSADGRGVTAPFGTPACPSPLPHLQSRGKLMTSIARRNEKQKRVLGRSRPSIFN